MAELAVGEIDRHRWEQVKLLFSAALEKTVGQRTQYLRQMCGSDDALYQQVALLLSHDEDAGSFLRSQSGLTSSCSFPDEASPGVFAPGDLVAKRFRILGLVGRGGMGEVYEAGDLERNVRVALKTLPKLAPQRLYRFKQEFRTLAGITHPNLVSLFELVGAEDQWFFTMEYIDGRDLLASVENASAFPGELPSDAGKLRPVLAQVADALGALHAAGKLHCDIKPSNVMVTPEGRAVVLDFGLSISLKDASAGRATAGTVAYMSPEQAAGDLLAESSDWYSFGVMLFQALTGTLPFDGSAQQIMTTKQEFDAPHASTRASGIPDDLADLCNGLLKRDPSKRPSGNGILERLREGSAPASRRPRESGPFVGRVRELELLQTAYSAAQTPQIVVAFVHGPSGTGKSALIEHYLSGDATKDAVILRGRCYEQESVPYKAIDESVDAMCKYLANLPIDEQARIIPDDTSVLAQLFPVLGQLLLVEARMKHAQPIADPQELRRRAFRSLRQLLIRAAIGQPLILYIDDLQWGDLDGALLLEELLSAGEPAAILLICSYRREYVGRSACLTTLLDAAGRHRVQRVDIPVDPLSAEESRELASTLLTGEDEARSERIARESGGNAYFIRELVQKSGEANGAADSLTGLIGARVANLPENSRRLLEIIALHGRPLTQADAFAAGDFDHRSLTTLAPLRAGNLVRIAGIRQSDEVEPFHDQIRETVVELIAPETRRRYHHGLGLALESSNRGDAETLAVHFAGAGESVKAGHYYLNAADQASAALAFERAARLYRSVLQQDIPASAGEPLVRRNLAEALSNSGRGIDAAKEFQHAARLSNSAEQFALERNAAYHYCAGGYLDQGTAVFREVLARVGLRLPESRIGTLAILFLRRLTLAVRGLHFHERLESKVPQLLLSQVDAAYAAGAGLVMADQICGMAQASLSTLLAFKAGEPLRLVRTIMLEASNIAGEGWTGIQRSRRLLDVGHQIVARHDRPILLGWISMGEGGVAFLLGRWRECVGHMEQAEAVFSTQCTGVVWELASVRMLILYSMFNSGQLIDMQQRSPALLREADEREDLYSYATIATFSQPMVLAMANRPDAARAMVRDSLHRWEERAKRGHHLQHVMGALTLMWMDFYDGGIECPENYLDEQWRLLRKNFFDRIAVLRVYYLDSRARTALRGAAKDARYFRIAEKAIGALRKERTPLGWAYAATCASGLAAERGRTEDAIAHLETACGHFEQLGMMAQFWSARRRLGELMGGSSGGAAIHDADDWFHRNHVEDPRRFAQMLTGYKAMS